MGTPGYGAHIHVCWLTLPLLGFFEKLRALGLVCLREIDLGTHEIQNLVYYVPIYFRLDTLSLIAIAFYL